MPIEIKITGDTPEDIAKDIMSLALLVRSPAEPKPRGATKLKGATEVTVKVEDTETPQDQPDRNPKEEPDEKPDVSPEAEGASSDDPAADKIKAIGILMPLFSAANKADKDRILALAKDYGAKKFADIDDAKGTELLDAAKKLQVEMEAEKDRATS